MNRDGKDIQTNRGTVEEGSLPGFLGNEGKSKEVSSVFAAILTRGCHQGNESQGTVQNHWLDPVEKLAKDNGVWIGKLSSKACTCGYVNHGLQLHERTWVCPECGTVHKRDLLAANNILRQGIVELESVSKSKNAIGASSRSRLHPRISFFQG